MNFLCPACSTPLPKPPPEGVVPCTQCGVAVDLTRVDTSPGVARMSPEVDLAGETLGPYHLEKRLAAGGMGAVYEAEGPDGPCAVKVLSALLAADPELRARFRREALALRAIRHGNVVRVLDEGEDRGFCYYAMERIDGPDLRARIAQGPLPAAEVEHLARCLLSALSEAHRKGFVHRDVKPANVLLAADGPRLCDFGIARYDGSTTLTESAAVMGSLRYMAPEQRLGLSTPQSDLYALGIVLWEALAGGVPGAAPLPTKVPWRLRKLLAALLVERPADRCPDAWAAKAVLDQRVPRAAVAASVAVAIVLVGGAGAFLALRGRFVPPAATVEPPVAAVTASPEPPARKVTDQPGANAMAGPAGQGTPTASPAPAEGQAAPAQAGGGMNAISSQGTAPDMKGAINNAFGPGPGVAGIGVVATGAEAGKGLGGLGTQPAPQPQAMTAVPVKPGDAPPAETDVQAVPLPSKNTKKAAAPIDLKRQYEDELTAVRKQYGDNPPPEVLKEIELRYEKLRSQARGGKPGKGEPATPADEKAAKVKQAKPAAKGQKEPTDPTWEAVFGGADEAKNDLAPEEQAPTSGHGGKGKRDNVRKFYAPTAD